MKEKFSTSGFTLVETMIAAAVLGGLALVGMSLTKSQIKSSTKFSFDSELILIVNEMNGILSDPNKCLATLGGKNALSTTTGINSINGNKYYSQASGSAPANGYGNANISIASYALNAAAPNVAANNSFFIINFQNKNLLKGQTGPSQVTKKINLYVEVDGSNNITKCRSLSNASTDIWTRGSGSSIFYGGGNVGIGTTNPQSILEIDSQNSVIGSIGFGVLNGDMWFDGGSDSNFVINNRGATSGATIFTSVDASGGYQANLTILNNGNVGIRTGSPKTTLDVAGAMKPGDETQATTCDANTEGSQRYNKGAHQMQYCGYNAGPPASYSWYPMGGSGSPTCVTVSVGGQVATCPANYTVMSCSAGMNKGSHHIISNGCSTDDPVDWTEAWCCKF